MANRRESKSIYSHIDSILQPTTMMIKSVQNVIYVTWLTNVTTEKNILL